ncbi:hypothetical protein BDV96DRAFT_597117 [Lophiotrema nucula]|uniref:Uncharacterized protein n=1 Tax=Lophiotrema nucula TaxID=690887 RepID=A0A6A5ZFK3_9PLEO|nr:hypothetical protein BDV96DRAFT_597117 [Lophiotrema nucula]
MMFQSLSPAAHAEWFIETVAKVRAYLLGEEIDVVDTEPLPDEALKKWRKIEEENATWYPEFWASPKVEWSDADGCYRPVRNQEQDEDEDDVSALDKEYHQRKKVKENYVSLEEQFPHLRCVEFLGFNGVAKRYRFFKRRGTPTMEEPFHVNHSSLSEVVSETKCWTYPSAQQWSDIYHGILLGQDILLQAMAGVEISPQHLNISVAKLSLLSFSTVHSRHTTKQVLENCETVELHEDVPPWCEVRARNEEPILSPYCDADDESDADFDISTQIVPSARQLSLNFQSASGSCGTGMARFPPSEFPRLSALTISSKRLCFEPYFLNGLFWFLPIVSSSLKKLALVNFGTLQFDDLTSALCGKKLRNLVLIMRPSWDSDRNWYEERDVAKNLASATEVLRLEPSKSEEFVGYGG